VARWIETVEDISTLSKLYRLTYDAYSRIQPELGKEFTCTLTQRYLLKCIEENVVDSEEIDDRWESAQTLHAWFCQLAEMENTSVVLENAARAVTELLSLVEKMSEMSSKQVSLSTCLKWNLSVHILKVGLLMTACEKLGNVPWNGAKHIPALLGDFYNSSAS
jgi:hypothetical protein